ncbi:histone deacetylase [Spongiibacter nanhainus]|uniref:Histone deacetylase n=1 Tax=Spongiibacter nanhainus TaxID=2794344 RepID=A0A7T4QYZ9_9GAMM|nr:histone deacetylase [Spongiibacter nanhainus]QQD17380.1 histone deacetylase [Spongiibacter nanhainus]
MTLPPLVHNPTYSFDFDPRHRFPMEKFSLLHSYLQESGHITSKNLFRPGKCRQDILAGAHCPNYIDRFSHNQLDRQELRRLGLPWSAGLVHRSWIAPNGTLLTAQLALRYGLACHLAGGTHHAHREFGSGFCVFNDLAVAATAMVERQQVKKVLIFDCDVHQGDGTASILSDQKRVFTCSIHAEKNFPARKALSDLDVPLPSGMGDTDYLHTVEQTLVGLLESVKPELVLYDAGVDIYCDDPLGLLNISLAGIRERDRVVIQACLDRGVPVATVIGGGYDRDRPALVRRHAMVIEEACRLYPQIG